MCLCGFLFVFIKYELNRVFSESMFIRECSYFVLSFHCWWVLLGMCFICFLFFVNFVNFMIRTCTWIMLFENWSMFVYVLQNGSLIIFFPPNIMVILKYFWKIFYFSLLSFDVGMNSYLIGQYVFVDLGLGILLSCALSNWFVYKCVCLFLTYLLFPYHKFWSVVGLQPRRLIFPRMYSTGNDYWILRNTL